MPPNEHIACLKEGDWGRLWEVIKGLSEHVVEGNREGGWRDRLMIDEMNQKNNSMAITALDKKVDKIGREFTIKIYKTSILSGVIGGLVAVGSKDILQMFIAWFMKGWK